MTTTETDLQQLEEYLDGALDDAAATRLRVRLQSDATLATALAEAQSQRAIRQAALKTLEPDDATSERLVWRIRGAMLDQQRTAMAQPKTFWSQWRAASAGSAVAACLLVGFTFGRIGHRDGAVAPIAPAGVATNDPSSSTSLAMNRGDQSDISSKFTSVQSVPRISVPVTNEYGQVVAWQTFDNAEQAKSFTEELQRSHGGDSSSGVAGQTKLAADEQVQPQKVPF